MPTLIDWVIDSGSVWKANINPTPIELIPLNRVWIQLIWRNYEEGIARSVNDSTLNSIKQVRESRNSSNSLSSKQSSDGIVEKGADDDINMNSNMPA